MLAQHRARHGAINGFIQHTPQEGYNLLLWEIFDQQANIHEWQNCKTVTAKHCITCQEIITKRRHKYCEHCRQERRRYTYPFFTPEQKLKHRQACLKWQYNHPEEVRRINLKSGRKYQAKQKTLKENLLKWNP